MIGVPTVAGFECVDPPLQILRSGLIRSDMQPLCQITWRAMNGSPDGKLTTISRRCGNILAATGEADHQRREADEDD